MEILPGIHAVPLLGARGHLILEPELTLIDTGLKGSRPRLQRYLQHQGRSLRELRRIVCTHGHPDHAGAVAELVAGAAEDIEVLMHPADIARLELTLGEALRQPSLARLFAAITPVPERARPMAHGEVLPLLDGLEVIHTPGHTPGSICLYDRARGALFVGDALENRGGRVSFASRIYSDDYGTARQSVKLMAKLDVTTIVFAHWAPVREGANKILRDLAQRAGTG
jgi:glyoxylase-like metal-dependent hydrolase (beta-lactamase superfamily II)